jgi:hypothetical protein
MVLEGDPQGVGTTCDVECPPCSVPPQDTDGDGDVDLQDLAAFTGCLNGPNIPWAGGPECVCLDTEPDGDVDLNDFTGFQEEFTGP